MKEKPGEETELIKQEVIKNGLQLFDPIEAGLQALRDQYADLKINGNDDKEGYKVVYNAVQALKGTNAEIEKVRKKAKEPALEFGRKVDAEAKRIKAEVDKLLEPLSKQREDYEAEQARSRKAEEQAARERLQERINQMRDKGMEYTGTHYVIGSIQVTTVQVQNADDEKFGRFMAAVESEHAKVQAAVEAEERRRAEEAKRLEEERAHLKAEREALEKLKAGVPSLNPPAAPANSPRMPESVAWGNPAWVAQNNGNPVTHTRTAEPAPQPAEETQGYTHMDAYRQGFEYCRVQVISILEGPEKFTRAQLMEKINALQHSSF